MAPPPPPPPPPLCLPFRRSKSKARHSWAPSDNSDDIRIRDQTIKRPSYSPTSTMTSEADNLTFVTDSERYDEIPQEIAQVHYKDKGPQLVRSNTMTGTKKAASGSKWGYGWGIGKQKEKQKELEREMYEPQESFPTLPRYQPPHRSNSQSTQASKLSQSTYRTNRTQSSTRTQETQISQASHHSQQSQQSQQSQSSSHTQHSQNSALTQDSGKSKSTQRSQVSFAPILDTPIRHVAPRMQSNDSASTLVGSALERKANPGEERIEAERPDTTERLKDLRTHMSKDSLDYYIIPSEDAHGSEYVAASDKRREFISGFTGSAGQAIVTPTKAYLITDSRYWLQARQQIDGNWTLVRAGAANEKRDWIEWLASQAKDAKIGIDARMISYEKANLLKSKVEPLGCKLYYPPQNLIDLVWKDKPTKSKEPVFKQPYQYTGEDASSKLQRVREWIKQQPPSVPSFHKGPPTPNQINGAVLLTSLPQIAYLLNLRGSDVPYNPLFHAYLFIGLEMTVLFIDKSKIPDEIQSYLAGLNIERKDYTELWPFLRKKDWGDAKVILSPQTSYAIALMLTHFRITILPPYVEHMMSVKNSTELNGLRQAYLRDGATFVRFLAWLENKLQQGYDITEWEAAFRHTEFRRKNDLFMGLAYENISATGPNAALPHYSPRKTTAVAIDRNTPYLHDSGGQYRDGTCDTTRTVHFGKPTSEQCEAFTRVLQGHIAIDSAVFPEGTCGYQLDVLARKALWKDGMNYLHGTGHGFGSFLTVHEGSHSFSSQTPLVAGNVITNEPGFYLEGKWGIRIESALIVKEVKPKGTMANRGMRWLGFERLTCVPIQSKMVKESMLTKEEKQWLKEHNQRCYEKLAPLLKDDKRAMKWLKKEADRGIGIATGPGGLTVEWD
ncbi:hypothetical protein AX16_002990 [Volvariella volvacea WC 439]|nr:hypothetical protein AX16_002990 [Volvariella volvacea WC 439]